MSPSNTVFIQGLMSGPVPIRNLSTSLIQRLLSGTYSLSLMEVIGLQSECDRRRDAFSNRYGRRSHRLVPYLNDRTVQAFARGYFDIRVIDSQEEDNYNVHF